jgi:hypothetical protein
MVKGYREGVPYLTLFSWSDVPVVCDVISEFPSLLIS